MSTHVRFKTEGSHHGVDVGPMTVTHLTDEEEAAKSPTARRYDPNAPKPAWGTWVTRTEARRVALEHGVELEEA